MKKGFTLLEVIIYIGIISIITSAFVTYALNVSDIRLRAVVEQEVNANGRIALDIIRKHILGSDDVVISDSDFGTDPGELVLCIEDTLSCSLTSNQIEIKLDQDDGALNVTVGTNPTDVITSDQVQVTSLVFQFIDQTNILIKLKIRSNTSGSANPYTHTKYFQTALNLR